MKRPRPTHPESGVDQPDRRNQHRRPMAAVIRHPGPPLPRADAVGVEGPRRAPPDSCPPATPEHAGERTGLHRTRHRWTPEPRRRPGLIRACGVGAVQPGGWSSPVGQLVPGRPPRRPVHRTTRRAVRRARHPGCTPTPLAPRAVAADLGRASGRLEVVFTEKRCPAFIPRVPRSGAVRRNPRNPLTSHFGPPTSALNPLAPTSGR